MPDAAHDGAPGAGSRPVSTMRAEVYRRLMAAEDAIADARLRRGVAHEAMLAALDAVDLQLPDDACREDLYLSALALFVQALGGRLEVRAVFDDETVLVSQR